VALGAPRSLSAAVPFRSYDFKGVIDYVFGTSGLIKLGVLGPMDFSWFQDNKIVGCPFPGIPSDRKCSVDPLNLGAG